MNRSEYPRLGLRAAEPLGIPSERSGESIPWRVDCPYAATYSSLATVSALEGLTSEHGTHEKQNPRRTVGEDVRGRCVKIPTCGYLCAVRIWR